MTRRYYDRMDAFRRIGQRITNILRNQHLWNYFLTLVLILLAIFMISEHAARVTASELLAGKANDLYKQLSSEQGDGTREKLRVSLETAQYLKSFVDAIIVSGYRPTRDLEVVTNQAETLDRRIIERVQSLLDHHEPMATLLSGSSNMLIGFITIVCCGIGASLASIRRNSPTPLISTGTGFITGFVVFLVLMGGKTIFLNNASEVVLPVNPYSSAMAALVVGMFTERAYQILDRLVTELARRIEELSVNVSSRQSERQNSSTPDASKETPRNASE